MEAFLETTAIVDLIFKDKNTARKVREVLKQAETKYSSQYVRMEIKRGVLSYYVLLYNKSVECPTLHEVTAYVQRLSPTPARHRIGSMLSAITAFFTEVENTDLHDLKNKGRLGDFQKRMLEAYLRRKIRMFWRSFERVVDVVIDDVECYKNGYTLHPPRFEFGLFNNVFENCDNYKPGICRIRSFINQNESHVSSIRAALEKARDPDEETRKRLRALKDVLRLKKKELTRRQCWDIGDAIIILEAPTGSQIVNNNARHFDPMCKVVGKRSMSY